MLPLNIQLLWLEGKPVPIVQPQGGADAHGHRLYRGRAPIFITTSLRRIEEMETDARHADADGRSSEWTMLLRRLKAYRYRCVLPRPEGQIQLCARCFAQFLLQAHAQAQHRASQ